MKTKKDTEIRNRVLARQIADDDSDRVLQSISGGCTGSTCTLNSDSDIFGFDFDPRPR